MDWLSFVGAIVGGLIGGLFTYLGVRLTIRHDDKKRYEDERRKAIENRPRLELFKYKDCNHSKAINDADLNAVFVSIEDIKFDEKDRIRIFYNENVLDDKNLVCVEYIFKNTGNTEIDEIILVTSYPKNSALLEYSQKNIYVNKHLLNYDVYSEKRFIKPGGTISLKIFYLKGTVGNGLFGSSCGIYLRDINGRFWFQPLFAPSKESDNSRLSSYQEFKSSCDIDVAIKCFKGELYW